LDENRKRDVELMALSIDDLALSRRLADDMSKDGVKPDFLFLSDPDHKVIDRYGLLNPDGRGWPHPTVFVIDKAGVVRWKFIEVNYRIRPTNEMILDALDRVARTGR
jgi:alkyl hydroperoxide reductase subunit AhpC